MDLFTILTLVVNALVTQINISVLLFLLFTVEKKQLRQNRMMLVSIYVTKWKANIHNFELVTLPKLTSEKEQKIFYYINTKSFSFLNSHFLCIFILSIMYEIRYT